MITYYTSIKLCICYTTYYACVCVLIKNQTHGCSIFSTVGGREYTICLLPAWYEAFSSSHFSSSSVLANSFGFNVFSSTSFSSYMLCLDFTSQVKWHTRRTLHFTQQWEPWLLYPRCSPRSPVYRSSNLVGTLRHIDSIGLRVERPYSPSSRRIPWYVSRSLAHTHADFDPTMPNMCTGSFYVLQRLNNSCAIYAIYTVVPYIARPRYGL